MKTLQCLCLFASILLTVSCSNSEKPTITEEQEKVRHVFSTFVNAVEAGDVDAYLSHLTDDYVGYDAGVPPITNRDSLRTMLTGFFAANTFKVSDYKSEEIIIRDDVAIHRHRGFITITKKSNGKKNGISGKVFGCIKEK